MALISKSRDQIKADMISSIQLAGSQITDFNEGSVIDTILGAVANEIDDAYFAIDNAYKESLISSASDANLDDIGAGFNITRSGAQPSIGVAKFERLNPYAYDITIPAGTIITTDPYISADVVEFETNEEMTLPALQLSVSGAITSVEYAMASNVLIGKLNTISSALPLIDSVTNDAETSGGLDEEADEAYRTRIVEILTSNSKGTKVAIEAYARLQPGIVSALMEDNTPAVGYANLYMASSGGTPTTAQIAYAEAQIENHAKPAGAIFTYYGAVTVMTNVTATVYYDANHESLVVKDNVETAIRDFLITKELGQDVYMSEIISTAMAVDGVLNIYSITINGVATDLTIDPSEVSRPNTISITVV